MRRQHVVKIAAHFSFLISQTRPSSFSSPFSSFSSPLLEQRTARPQRSTPPNRRQDEPEAKSEAIPHTSSLSHIPFLYVRFSVSVSFSSSLSCLLASSTAKTTANRRQNRRQKLLNELGEDRKKLRGQEAENSLEFLGKIR
ncbi:hypothetical protein Dimus_039746 [Dionaea muscipula]